MFNKLKDIIREVFWLKKSTPKKRARPAARKRVVKKRTIIKKAAPPKPKPVLKIKPKKILAIAKKKTPVIDPNLVQAGEVTHYFERIKVCVVKVTHGSILIGDRLTIKGPKTSFVQKVWSMQIESQDVKVAKKGQMIGLKVEKPVVVGDIVYK